MKPYSDRAIRVLGTRAHPLTIPELHDAMRDAVSRGARVVIANHNLHSVALAHRHPDVRAFYDAADLTHVDGRSLLLWARALGHDVNPEQRVTYVDWIGPLMDECARRRWRVFFLGGRPGVGDAAGRALRAPRPDLVLATRDGYFDEHGADNDDVLRDVAAFAPHVLLVGMGMPRQERWVRANLDRLTANVVLPCGACMDYVAGVLPTPPRWMGRAGLEWLHRLSAEPRRLAGRYLVEPWGLLPLMAADVRARRRPDGRAAR